MGYTYKSKRNKCGRYKKGIMQGDPLLNLYHFLLHELKMLPSQYEKLSRFEKDFILASVLAYNEKMKKIDKE